MSVNSEVVLEYQGCAVASQGQFVKRLRLIQRSGTVYNISYSNIPHVILTKDGRLIIKSYRMFIEIIGRGLQYLEQYLAEENVKYVKESPSNIDDGEAIVFVSEINIVGKALDDTKPEDESDEE